MNNFYEASKVFQEAITQYAWSIFKTYGRELVLRLEEYNLLQNKNNCIESSTAIGFVLEEFIVSKLEMFTHCSDEEYRIDRFSGATTQQCYDCFSIKDEIKFLVNIKAQKSGAQGNDAIAAISQLHQAYCLDNPRQQKSFIVFKVIYSIADAYEDTAYRRAKPRHIHIDDIKTYCIEEVDFSKGHQQDNRNWKSGATSSRNNGRLKISDAFKRSHKVSEDQISYINTYHQIHSIVKKNNDNQHHN